MSRRIWFTILVAIGITASVESAWSAQVFYFSQENAKCLWRLFDPATGKNRAYHATETCPTHVIFDRRARRTLYVLGDAIWSKAWKSDSKQTRLANLPEAAAKSPPRNLADLWAGNVGGKIRVAYLNALDEDTGVRREAGRITYLYDGRSFDATELEIYEGVPYMAEVLELNDAGTWKRIALRPTVSDAGDTPGLSVVLTELANDPQTITLGTLLAEGKCEASPCGTSALKNLKPAKDTLAWISKQFPGSEEGGPVYMPFSEGRGVLFQTAFGDTNHAVPPVQYCQDECTRHTLIVGLDSQLNISVNRPFVLIAEEYSGRNPRVFGAKADSPIFQAPGASSAVWLSIRELWELASSAN